MYNNTKEPDKRELAKAVIDEMARLKRKGEVIVRFDGSGSVKTIERKEVH